MPAGKRHVPLRRKTPRGLEYRRQRVCAAFTSFACEGIVNLRVVSMGSDNIVEFRRTKQEINLVRRECEQRNVLILESQLEPS